MDANIEHHGMPSLLLIEDDPAVAAFLTDALQTFFFVGVLVASSGVEARKIWAERGCSIVAILSDLNLPGESGLSVVRALIDGQNNLTVVFMTGDVYRDAEVASAMGTPVGFLMKPFLRRCWRSSARACGNDCKSGRA